MPISRRNLRLLAGLLLVLLLPLVTGLVQAQDERTAAAQFEPAECWFEKPIPFFPGPEFECGYVTVPERHEDPDGPQIRLPVAVSRASGEGAKPDPLFLAQGGPGGDAFEVFSVLLGTSNVWRDRDVVIFNQRGTKYADPDLSCTESFDAAAEVLELSPDDAEARSLELLQQCYDRLTAEGVDLSAFNSVQNAADVNALRQALGYDSYNFYGVSYGTLLGLHLLRDQPDGLRSVILDGVVPTDLNFIPRVTANTDRVFKEIIQTCEADAECRQTYPDLESRLFALVEKLNESPITLTIRDGETGERAKARLDGDTLIDIMFQAFYLPNSYAYFPKLIDNLEAGDYTFVEGIWPLFAFDRSISEGMYFSVICAEDADIDPSEVELDGVNPYFASLADADLQSYADACAIWQVEKLPGEVDDPVVSDIPVLLMSGHYDPITPPDFAEVAAASLTNEVHVIHPTGSHGVAFGELCLDSILMQFLANPGGALDTDCLGSIEPQAFAPDDALSFALVGEINQLSDTVAWQFGLAALFLLIIWSAYLVLPLSWFIRKLRKKQPADTSAEGTRLGRLGGLAVLAFGFLAFVFVAGATYYTFDALFSGLASIFAISGAAAPFFAIPPVLALIAAVLVVLAVLAWRGRHWSTWSRLYFTIVSIAAVAYIVVIAQGGMLTMLL